MILSARSASTRCLPWASRAKWWIAKQPCGLGLGLGLGFWELGTSSSSCQLACLFQEACMLAVLWQAEELGHSFERVRSDEHLASVFLHHVDNEQVRVNAWPLIK